MQGMKHLASEELKIRAVTPQLLRQAKWELRGALQGSSIHITTIVVITTSTLHVPIFHWRKLV